MATITTQDQQAALGFLVSQTAHIETRVNEKKMPDIQYPRLIPVDTSAHPFAKTIEYRTSDKFGKADWINGNSDDIPLAGSEMGKSQVSVHMAGIGYGYGYEEINQAQMMGYNLQADDAIAARRASEEHIDRVALNGDTTKGMNGLINNPNVAVGAAVTGDWANATNAQILADLNKLLLDISTDTMHTASADTVLLSPEKLNLLATRYWGDTGKTLLALFKENNTYTAVTGQPLTAIGVRGLSTAGVGGVQRMVAYKYDEDVLRLHLPMPHQFLPAHQTGVLNWTVPGVFRLAGLDIRRPKEVRYGDGI